MKQSLILFLFIASIFITFDAGTVSSTEALVNSKSQNISEYTIRVFINNKFYLITYNSEGYIINVVIDDE